MEDGTLLIMGPDTGGNSALDYDGRFQMNGGTPVSYTHLDVYKRQLSQIGVTFIL